MIIDCHTHCRDEEQKEKETIEHALRVAEDSLISAIFDMPNVTRPVISRQRVLERFELAQNADSRVVYAVHIGLTPDKYQIKEAVETCREFSYKPGCAVFAAGLKLFTIESGSQELVVSELEQ